MNKSKWPLIGGVVVVGALAGLALGGRPTTLPTVNIPASTSSVPAADTNSTPTDTLGG